MSDSRLRALAREVALTGGLDARVRLLVERARVGDLARERLRLAAYLRDPAARRALLPDVVDPPKRGSTFLSGLAEFGLEACLRAAVALGRSVDARAWCGGRGHEVRELLDAVTLWLECPCGDHQRNVRQAARVPGLRDGAGDLLGWMASSVNDLSAGAERAALAAWPLLFQAQPVEDVWDDWDGLVRRPVFLADASALRRALEPRLVPWALG